MKLATNKKSQKIVRMLMINGWLIILLVIVILGLNALGLFEFIKKSSHRCILGDGLECTGFSAAIDDSEMPSDGDDQDTIKLIVKNNIKDLLYNFKIEVVKCEETNSPALKVFRIEDTLNYTIKGCKGMLPRRTFSSPLVVAYETRIGEKRFQHESSGYLSTHVDAPEPPSNWEKFKAAFMMQFRKYVG